MVGYHADVDSRAGASRWSDTERGGEVSWPRRYREDPHARCRWVHVLARAGNAAGAGTLQPLAPFMSNPAGAAIVDAVGPIRQLVQADAGAMRRHLVIASGTAAQPGAPIQRQR